MKPQLFSFATLLLCCWALDCDAKSPSALRFSAGSSVVFATLRFSTASVSGHVMVVQDEGIIGQPGCVSQCIACIKGVTKGVTRMAYSPSLWLMAIGWWNKINQCRKLKLNLTQTWGVCMSLDSGMHWSQNQWYCESVFLQKRVLESASCKQCLQYTVRQCEHSLQTTVWT